MEQEKISLNFTEVSTEERNKIRLDVYDYII